MSRLTRKDGSGRYYVDSKDIGFYSTSRDENGHCTFGGEHVDKLAKYEDLGTVEELQQSIERQTSKQIITKVQAEDLKIGHITFKSGTKSYWCPCCKLPVTLAGSFCQNCGQAFKLEK